MKTLVVGGTGTVGSLVAGELLKRGSAVRVMTRSAGKFGTLLDGVEGAVGDLQKPETLGPAFAGVDALFLATALAPDEINQGLAAVEAAKNAKLRHIVFMSVHNLESGLHIPHFATKLPIEHAVKTSGIPYTLVRPNNFFQNDFWLSEALLKWGVYPQPIGTKGLNRVDVRDIAESVAISITQPGHAGKCYSIVGSEALTGARTAEIYSRHLGREIRYTGDDLEAWAQQAGAMMPPWQVLDLRIMYAHFLKNGLVATGDEIAQMTRILGHPARGFEAFVAEVAQQWRA
jgi:uncharacterized protein YbjT (DUF2867 family)